MSGHQAIIDKILFEAQQKADLQVGSAKQQAQQILAAAYEQNLKIDQAALKKAQAQAQTIITSRLREVDLELRRSTLAVRYAAIEQAFAAAKKRILALKDADYLDYIKKQIMANAKNNDQVIICQNDKKRISPAFISGVAKQMGISLSLCDTYGDFEGGIVLRNEYYDCNITIECSFRFLREKMEGTVSKILAGEN